MVPLEKEERHRLLAGALEARNLSYSPYSKFRVGAAILTDSGDLILGANIENASYPAGICAERTAIVKALTSGAAPGTLRAIAVAGDIDGPTAPCGICRQVIREFCTLDTELFFPYSSWSVSSHETRYVRKSLGDLLPMSFGPEDLDKPRSQT